MRKGQYTDAYETFEHIENHTGLIQIALLKRRLENMLANFPLIKANRILSDLILVVGLLILRVKATTLKMFTFTD